VPEHEKHPSNTGPAGFNANIEDQVTLGTRIERLFNRFQSPRSYCEGQGKRTLTSSQALLGCSVIGLSSKRNVIRLSYTEKNADNKNRFLN